MSRYLIDFEIVGSITVDSPNPQAAAAHAIAAVKRAVAELNKDTGCELEYRCPNGMVRSMVQATKAPARRTGPVFPNSEPERLAILRRTVDTRNALLIGRKSK